MSITREQAAHLAGLAKLELDETTQERFARQISDILRYMDVLNTLDTQGVEALYQPVRHSGAPRPDRVEASLDRKKLLAVAPETDGRYFVVPRIVG